jgi:hypothetical protein
MVNEQLSHWKSGDPPLICRLPGESLNWLLKGRRPSALFVLC